MSLDAYPQSSEVFGKNLNFLFVLICLPFLAFFNIAVSIK